MGKSLACPRALCDSHENTDHKLLPMNFSFPAPVLLKKIQAEIFPDHPGNIKLSCQFAEIHEDSTVMWTKDSKLIAQAQRRCAFCPGYFSWLLLVSFTT